METILHRIEKIAIKEGLKITALEKRIGASKGVLSRAINNGTDIQTKWIQAIVENFPCYSEMWLLTGKGQMEKSDSTETESSATVLVKDEVEKTLPHVPLTALAGKLSEALDGVTLTQCEQFPVVKAFPTYDYTISIQGDSMYPKYESGDRVACRMIKDSAFLQWGRVHVLDTTQGIIIKRIYEEGDSIRCVSYNPEYPDILVPKNEIYSLSLVVGQLRV